MKMYLAMYKNKKVFTDKLIAFVSRGNYTHCEIILKEEDDTRMYSASVRDGKKVRCKSTKDIEFKEENWDLLEFEVAEEDYKDFIEYFNLIKGMKYGFKSLFFNHVLRLPFDFQDEMICSEFCAIAINFLFDTKLTSEQKDSLLKKAHLLTPSTMLSKLCEVGILGNKIDIKDM